MFVLPSVAKKYPFFENRLGWFLCAVIVLLPLLQLIPLPPWIWSKLPGHGLVASNLDLLNGNMPWLPISVSPSSTWLAAVSLIPPLTMFLAVLLLSRSERLSLVIILVTFSVVSIFIGLLQIAQGFGGSLYFFEITNPGEAVGFFANKNHFAALIYSALVFVCSWVINAGLEFEAERNKRGVSRAYLPMLIGAAAVLIILSAAEMIIRSRAGLVLALAGAVASGAFAVFHARSVSRMKIAKWSVLAILAAALFAGGFGLQRVIERVATDPLQDARLPIARTTLSAASHYLPFGSGFGTFPSVYGIFERATDIFASTYINRAHNDLAEVFLEGGVFGIGLILALLICFARRTSQIWRHRPGGTTNQEILLAHSATIVIGLLLLHSLVDYPLRTGGMMAVLAMTCALLIYPNTTDIEPAETAPSIAARRRGRSKRPALQGTLQEASWRSNARAPATSTNVESNLRGSDDLRAPDLEEPDLQRLNGLRRGGRNDAVGELELRTGPWLLYHIWALCTIPVHGIATVSALSPCDFMAADLPSRKALPKPYVLISSNRGRSRRHGYRCAPLLP